jgi:hypothetical protein
MLTPKRTFRPPGDRTRPDGQKRSRRAYSLFGVGRRAGRPAICRMRSPELLSQFWANRNAPLVKQCLTKTLLVKVGFSRARVEAKLWQIYRSEEGHARKDYNVNPDLLFILVVVCGVVIGTAIGREVFMNRGVMIGLVIAAIGGLVSLFIEFQKLFCHVKYSSCGTLFPAGRLSSVQAGTSRRAS